MTRFRVGNEKSREVFPTIEKNQIKKIPFKNFYASVEEQNIYINMESIDELTKEMETLSDIALIVDISGSMKRYYQDGSILNLCRSIVETVSQYDDDGIDIYFFANGLISHSVVSSVNDVNNSINKALQTKGAYGTTMPTEAFEKFCEQLKRKNRVGTVLFLTDGVMDDAGKELKSFYQNYLHTQFRTRDKFYCYAIEFGRLANGALDILDGLYQPEQGAEDLFDKENVDNVSDISYIFDQVGGMTAIGSDRKVFISVEGNVVMDMINIDLMDRGVKNIEGCINKNMSIRAISREPFILKLKVDGYQEMKLRVIPQGLDASIEILNNY